MTRTLRESFARFLPSAPSAGGCLEWTGGVFIPRHGKPYGRIVFAGRHRGAHRVAWELANGPIPPGLLVCHRCDNPPCVNPAHLFLGTHADNVRDMIRKGRNAVTLNPAMVRGERHPSARLSTVDVLEIRRLRRAGVPQLEVAARFGVSADHVCRVFRGAAGGWAHVREGLE